MEIKDRTEAYISKAYHHPHPNCLRACFFSSGGLFTNLRAISVVALSPICALSLTLSWLSWPTVCGTHSSSHYLCESVYLFILPLTGPYVGTICPPKSLRLPSLPVFPHVSVSSTYSQPVFVCRARSNR